MKRCVPLEPAAEAVCDANSISPLIFELPVCQGRKRLEQAQDTPVYMYPARVETCQAIAGRWGTITVYFVIPEGCDPGHMIYYIHGAGWVFGSFHTHEKLVRELAYRTNSVVVFPEYTRAPEARYPVAMEQCYSMLCDLPKLRSKMGLTCCLDTLTVAGDSAGGTLATSMTILAKRRCGPRIHKQLLYYPVTNACFDTCTYWKFAENYYLYRQGMMWFWDQYAPDLRCRCPITASPLKADVQQLKGLPDTMILNGEADVLRYEGEAYARKLRRAGVNVTAVRFQAIIHDFVMLNALDQTNACRAAMDASVQWINQKNAEGIRKIQQKKQEHCKGK